MHYRTKTQPSTISSSMSFKTTLQEQYSNPNLTELCSLIHIY